MMMIISYFDPPGEDLQGAVGVSTSHSDHTEGQPRLLLAFGQTEPPVLRFLIAAGTMLLIH